MEVILTPLPLDLAHQGMADKMAKLQNMMAKLAKLDGAVTNELNPFEHVIQSPSPGFNYVFGGGGGLPLGFTLILYGPPRGGKSVMANTMIGQLHKDYPEAVAIKFDTEFRERGQMPVAQLNAYGIDKDRYMCFSVNSPELIFDRIEKDIVPLIQDGLDVKLIVIDSMTAIQGRRAQNADSVLTQQIGDHALTLQDGFKRLLPLQRKYNFAVVLTAHVRAEMDMAEQMRGNKVKMQAGFAVKHYAEYYLFLEPWLSKEGKTDLQGKKFENENITDQANNAERTGHKIRLTMKDSSLGPKGRTGIITLDYSGNIAKLINTHEEVFTLGVNWGVIERPNQAWYAFGGKKWQGKPAILDALRDDKALYDAVLKEVRRRDSEGQFSGPAPGDNGDEEEAT